MDTTPAFPTLRIVSHPLVQHKLSILRDRETPTKIFKELVDEIAMLMAYEATSDLALEDAIVDTPLERTVGRRVEREEADARADSARRARAWSRASTAWCPARASATSGSIAITTRSSRWTTTSRSRATRRSATSFCSIRCWRPAEARPPRCPSLKRAGATRIRFMCLVAAPEGVKRLAAAHPDVIVYCASLDRELNESGYILPGLGDAGDRLFGTR